VPAVIAPTLVATGLVNDYSPFVVSGLVTGSIIGIAAMGLVLTYKTSGLFNFGHGALAAAGAYVFFDFNRQHGLAWPVAGLLAVGVFGVLAGLVMERLSRGLAGVSTAYRIVATIGLLVAIRQIIVLIYGDSAKQSRHFLSQQTHQIGGVFVTNEDLIIAAIGLASAIGLYAFFRYSRLGTSMRAVVDDPVLLDMTGIAPTRVRRTAWVIGCCYGALSGVLFAPVVVLESITLVLLVVQAFSAAAIGGFGSLPLAYAGGLVVGVLQALSTRFAGRHPSLTGLPSSIPFIVLLVVLVVAGSRLKEIGRAVRTTTRSARQLPPTVARAGTLVVLAGLALVPQVVGTKLPIWNEGMTRAVLFLSLALLVRTSGQVSLCHLSFAAVGAAGFGHLAGADGWPWALALLGAGLFAVPFGALVSIPAIRLSGLYLALATFGFGLLVQQVLYRQSFLFGSGLRSSVTAPRPHIASLDTDTGFYYVLLAVLVMSAGAVLVVERSRLGRLLRGMADSPVALTTHGANVNITKVIVFCLSAFLAGISGALYAQIPGSINGDSFLPFNSLILLPVLAIAVAMSVGRTVPAALIASLSLFVIPGYVNDKTLSDSLGVIFGLSAVFAALVSQGSGITDILARANARTRHRRHGPASSRHHPTTTQVPAPDLARSITGIG
jgi:branched-subunit amino acid ABC-type transport system permease component